jgi:hypothetical protein
MAKHLMNVKKEGVERDRERQRKEEAERDKDRVVKC